MPIARVSKKQAAINRKVAACFQERLVEFDGQCTGCGTRYNLTPSHIIRRSKRPDLITEKDNIKPHCIRCHDKWDSGNILVMCDLLDFEDNMRYIKAVDPLLFNRFYEQMKTITLA